MNGAVKNGFNGDEMNEKEIILTKFISLLKTISDSEHTEEILKSLRNSVIMYDAPCDPVGLDDWNAFLDTSVQN